MSSLQLHCSARRQWLTVGSAREFPIRRFYLVPEVTKAKNQRVDLRFTKPQVKSVLKCSLQLARCPFRKDTPCRSGCGCRAKHDGPSELACRSLSGGGPGMPLTARVERGPSEAARSASTKGSLVAPASLCARMPACPHVGLKTGALGISRHSWGGCACLCCRFRHSP